MYGVDRYQLIVGTDGQLNHVPRLGARNLQLLQLTVTGFLFLRVSVSEVAGAGTRELLRGTAVQIPDDSLLRPAGWAVESQATAGPPASSGSFHHSWTTAPASISLHPFPCRSATNHESQRAALTQFVHASECLVRFSSLTKTTPSQVAASIRRAFGRFV